MYFLIKTLITALIVAAVSELARRYSLLAAALASLAADFHPGLYLAVP
jgi:hypothetical protein